MMPLNLKIYQILALVGIFTLIGADVFLAFQKSWFEVFITTVFTIASIAFVVWKNRLPSVITLLFVIMMNLNAAGWVFDIWQRFPWTDPLTHFFTSFVIALALGLFTYYSVQVYFKSHSFIFVLVIASLGLSVGAIWEIIEWTFNVEQSYRAVTSDLIADMIGSLLAGYVAAWIVRTEPDQSTKASRY